MNDFQLGETVEWISHSQGSHKSKRGEIVAVLEVGKPPSREQFPQLWKGAGPGMGRNHQTYVVKVGAVYYWPRVKHLKKLSPQSGKE